jgi:beta-lactamase regulating signal transducer with metallopeptidase domain
MKREFVVAEDEDEYGEIILSLAAIEVRPVHCVRVASAWSALRRRRSALYSCNAPHWLCASCMLPAIAIACLLVRQSSRRPVV